MKYDRYILWREISAMESVISSSKEVIKWKIDMLRIMQQWWFSNDVFNLKYIQNYIGEFDWDCFWWIWSERPKHYDVWLEKNRDASNDKLSEFLCSRIASRLLTDIKEEWKSIDRLKEYMGIFYNYDE